VSVSRGQRYSKRSRCPICDGAESDPRGQDRRCIGFLSEDGKWARCSREECAGAADYEESTQCWVHKLGGECACGLTHVEKPYEEKIEATYDYEDESGKLLYQVVRKTGKKFLQRRPDGAGGWIWKVDKSVRRVLYRLPQLLAADPEKVVLIVEGEKDVATLEARGQLATTNAQGAGKWNSVADNAREVLAGRRVWVIGDNDAPGRKHAKDIFLSLKGVASVEIYECTKGKDITEHLENGGTSSDLQRIAYFDEKCEPVLWGAEGSAAPPPEEPSAPSEPPPANRPAFVAADQKEITDRLVAWLTTEERPILVGDEQEIFGYEPKSGLFAEITRSEQSKFIQGLSGTKVQKSNRVMKIGSNDISGTFKLTYDRLSKPGFFSEPRAGLAFTNGFVRLVGEDLVLEPHSPDNRARFAYPFDYDATAPCDKWLGFLEDLFGEDSDWEQKVAVVQEHVGASLAGLATRFQRCVTFIGDGGEGKSTLAEVVSSLFPPGSTESIPPQEWEQEYRRAKLAGKLLNVVAELPEGDIIGSSAFKAIVAGEPITARHIRKDPFTHRPRAGHLFLANRLPGTPDQTRGFWRRFIIVRFNRNFSEDPVRDPDIANKIITAERPAIVAWALAGAARLVKQRGYTIPASHEAELENWRMSADQVSGFVNEKLAPTIDGELGLPGSELYKAYRDWAERNGHHSMSSAKFAGRLRELGYSPKKTKDSNRYGLKMRPEVDGSKPYGSGGSKVEETQTKLLS
jgi:putative DNA primase/helicase